MSTLNYYNRNAGEYFENTKDADMSEAYSRFEKYVPDGAKILDLGCGSGRDSRHFLEKGYTVSALDGSEELAKLASDYLGVDVICKDFNDIDYEDEFDAVWACASLLHISREMMKSALSRLNRALKDDGILYISVKCGDGEYVTNDGKFYCLYQEEELKEKIKSAGLKYLDYWISGDKLNRDIQWINIICKKD